LLFNHKDFRAQSKNCVKFVTAELVKVLAGPGERLHDRLSRISLRPKL